MMAPSAPAIAFVMPGQGSQRVGMLEPVMCVPGVQDLLDTAEEISGLPLRAIAEGGPDDVLAQTSAAQPLLYIADVAWATALANAGVSPRIVAGHSLGELAALAFAGVFSLAVGLELVCTRARLMAEATAVVSGGMAAVLGMDGSEIADLLEGRTDVWVANDNAPGQVVISGTHRGLEAATRDLAAAGARKIIPLNVAGAFHSPLMGDAATLFAQTVEAVAFEDATVPVISNAEPSATTDASQLRERLVRQMRSPVRWTKTMTELAALGDPLVVEAGPGSVLTGLGRRGGLESLAAETVGLDGVMEVAAG